jgi:hypothetical protein
MKSPQIESGKQVQFPLLFHEDLRLALAQNLKRGTEAAPGP